MERILDEGNLAQYGLHCDSKENRVVQSNQKDFDR